MENVDEAGLGAAGFITVTCRVCWLWVYDVTPWLYPGLGARKHKSGYRYLSKLFSLNVKQNVDLVLVY